MQTPNDSPTVSKQEAATRQLVSAIQMFFRDEDAVSVHTLACAAREIFEKHCTQANLDQTFDIVKEANPEKTEQELRNILNDPRNFFKHGGKSLEERIEFSDEMNDFVILAACHDCTKLVGSTTPKEIEVFKTWCLATHSYDPNSADPVNPMELHKVNRILSELDREFPKLRSASRPEQKRKGLEMLQHGSD